VECIYNTLTTCGLPCDFCLLFTTKQFIYFLSISSIAIVDGENLSHPKKPKLMYCPEASLEIWLDIPK